MKKFLTIVGLLTVIATPAVAGQSLFVRTDMHLYRIETK